MCDTGRCEVGAGFASRSVPVHLVRGVVGLGLLVAGFVLVPATGALSLLLWLPAGLAMRGCPTCWLVGLAQTRHAATEHQTTDPATDPEPASTGAR